METNGYSCECVMVNFMCQFGWPTVLRHLLKRYSGCFCENVLGLD